jgi:CheY-like chemotaxis protein
MTYSSTRLDGNLAKLLYGSTQSPKTAGMVLVVEDNLMQRVSAMLAVEDAGYVTVVAANAREALDALAEHPGIDVLFTDVQMPGHMNGYELAAEMRIQRPNLGILIASGGDAPSQSDLPSGALFFTKPYDMPLVTLALTELVGKARHH